MVRAGSTWSAKLISTELKLACRWPRWRLPFEKREVGPETRHRLHCAQGGLAGSGYSEGSVSRM